MVPILVHLLKREKDEFGSLDNSEMYMAGEKRGGDITPKLVVQFTVHDF